MSGKDKMFDTYSNDSNSLRFNIFNKEFISLSDIRYLANCSSIDALLIKNKCEDHLTMKDITLPYNRYIPIWVFIELTGINLKRDE